MAKLAGSKHLTFDIRSLDLGKYSFLRKSILLRALSIDYRQQGKGYATAAMLQLPTFVRECFPEVDEIVLAVNARNFTAQRLYLRTGFEDRGLTRLGPMGMQHIYHFKVERLND